MTFPLNLFFPDNNVNAWLIGKNIIKNRMSTMKCVKCHIIKNEDNFYRRNAKFLRKECKECTKKVANGRYKKIQSFDKKIDDINNKLSDVQKEDLLTRAMNDKELFRCVDELIMQSLIDVSEGQI